MTKNIFFTLMLFEKGVEKIKSCSRNRVNY